MKTLFITGEFPSLHKALVIRMREASLLVTQINKTLITTAKELERDLTEGTNKADWGDLGSLSHAVGLLEDVAATLGIEVENCDG